MDNLPLQTGWLPHAKLGALTGLWLAIFLVLIGPFDAGELPLGIRLRILPPYGLLFFVAYLTGIGLQNHLYRRWGKWNWWGEVLVMLITYGLGLLLSFLYYKTDIIRGTYGFTAFVGAIFLPTGVLLGFFLLAGRRYLRSLIASPAAAVENLPTVSLVGAGKKDILRLLPEQLVYAVSAQNYVEVFYLEQETLKKHLLRSTLKQVAEQAPVFVRVHRSHLINPAHFRRWSGSGSLEVHTVEIPVSKQYRESLRATLTEDANSSQKPLSSSQSQA